jgi:hypothetical protein
MPKNYSLDQAPANKQRLPQHVRDDDFIKSMLRRCPVGHIAHAWDDQPFITPTNFWYDEARNRIIFHSNIVGRMRANLERQPNAAFEVSEYGKFLPANIALEFSIQYRSVIVFGKIKILDDADEIRTALNALIKKYFPRFTPGREFRPITDKEIARTSVYALEIKSWSGKENWKDAAEQLDEWPKLSAELSEPVEYTAAG